MAEVKNSFISAKMNQDLDDRLVPQNEYRSAKNISIVSSNNSNNGVIQNITGNQVILNLGNDLPGMEIIGQHVDEINNIIYMFVTNYVDISFNGLNNPMPEDIRGGYPTYISAIYRYDLSGKEGLTIMVYGSFLNFSKTSPILNINLVEDLLFWTDNRNQPRKINVNTAYNAWISASPEDTGFYYTTEDHISVAKYAPISPISFINGNISTMKDVVSPLNPDGTANPNYNANFIGDKTFLQDKFVRFSYRYKYDDNEYSILAPFSQIAFVPQQDGSFMGTSTDLENDENTAFRSSVVEFMQNKINQVGLVIIFDSLRTKLFNDFKIKEIEIIYKESNSTTCYILDTIKTSSITYDINNLYKYIYTYESRKPKGVLPEDQLVRVYDKVPVRALTQETAGGRIIYGNYIDKNTPPLTIDYRVTINKKSDTLQKEFPLHNVKSNRNYQVGIVLSDRYGRQSDVILSPVDPTDLLSGGGRASSFYAPWYNPTLDSSEITGGVLNFFGNCISVVFDTPILQSTQDVRNPISNIDRNSTGTPGLYSPPYFAISAYNVDDEENFGPGPMTRNFSVWASWGGLYEPEYNYIVFEVQATMIQVNGEYNISSIIVTKSFAPVERGVFGSSTNFLYYIPNLYLNSRSTVVVTSVSIPNPTGWYSYKIVVKQQQQEYYNVYAAGALAGYPTASGSTAPTYPTGEDGKTSHLILFSDNINKIPRDLSLVGPEQRQFRSSVQLFGRVQNLDINNTYNQQFYPSTKGFSVPNIQAILDVAHVDDPTHYYQLQNGSIIARTNNNNVKFGAGHNNLRPKLCILETDPFVSNLDIYWETSTTGLISDLNTSISASNNPGVVSFGDVGWEFYENQSNLGTTNFNDVTGSKFTRYVTDWFYPLDSSNKVLTGVTITLTSAVDLTGAKTSDNFINFSIINSGTSYRIEAYGNESFSTSALRNQFILSFFTSVVINSVVVTNNINIQGSLTNINPIIYTPGQTFQGPTTNDKVIMLPIVAYRGIVDIYQFRGENGSNYLQPTSNPTKQIGLTWSFQDGTSSFNEGTGTTAVSLNLSTSGFLKVAGGSPGIRVQPVIKLTDAGGAFALLTVDLDFTLGEFNQGEFTPEYNI